MSGEEKMVIDALISISKSLNRIAGEISAIRKDLSSNKSNKSITNDVNLPSNTMISESSNAFVPKSMKNSTFYSKSKKSNKKLDSQSAVENIRDILNGEYIK
jgi:hypothetical protein